MNSVAKMDNSVKGLAVNCLIASLAITFLSTGRGSARAEVTSDQPIDTEFDEKSPPLANSKLMKKWENFMVARPTFFEAAATRRAKEDPVIEDPLETKLPPQWTSSCENKEDKLNETWVNIIVTNQHKFPKHLIEADAKDRGMFIKMLEANAVGLSHWPPLAGDEYDLGKSRRKRSAGVKGKQNDKWAMNTNGLVNPIVYKKSRNSKYGPTKKTTFSMGNKRYLIKPLGPKFNGKKYLVSSSEEVFDVQQQYAVRGTTTPAPTTGEAPKLSQAMDRLTDSLLANDIKLTWRVNSALHMITDLRKSMKRLINLIGGDKLSEEAGANLVSAIREQQKWFPRVESLIKENKQSAHYDSYLVLRNISNYIQFFDVVFEQMVHEQVNLDKKYAPTYRKLVQKGLELSCDIELMMRHIQDLKKDKSELIGQMTKEKLRMDDVNKPGFPKRIHPRSLRLADKQLHYDANTFESPNFKALIHKEPGRPDSIFVSRDVMPENQRKLNSSIERRIRDQWVFEELERFLTFYETILNNIYV